jgi:hypothetical protein
MRLLHRTTPLSHSRIVAVLAPPAVDPSLEAARTCAGLVTELLERGPLAADCGREVQQRAILRKMHCLRGQLRSIGDDVVDEA